MFLDLFTKKKKYVQEFTSRIVSLNLAAGWVEDQNIQEPLTFFREENAHGALQVSLITFDKYRIPPKEILLAKHKIKNFKEYKLREWDVYEFEESTLDNYNKSLYFVKAGVIAYITYNCNSKDNKELNEALNIAKSISVISKN